MTVKDLIEELKKYSPETIVCVHTDPDENDEWKEEVGGFEFVLWEVEAVIAFKRSVKYGDTGGQLKKGRAVFIYG